MMANATAFPPILGRPAPQSPGRPPAWPSLTAGESASADGNATGAAPGRRAEPALRFDEGDLAAVAASVAAAWRRRGQTEALEGVAARQARAVERAAEALAEASRRRQSEAALVREQALGLAAAIAQAFLPEAGDGRIVGALEALLRGLPEATSARIVVEPLAVEPLRAGLADIAARAGFTGSLEVTGDPRLPPGTVQLFWPGGWSEHVPARIHEHIARILAAHAPLAAAPVIANAIREGEQP